MKIWAHRGCSQRYPENTLLAFEKAAELEGLAGIELDIQMTRDGELVVIHDERVDRTTEGVGYVREYSLSELRKLHIYADDNPSQRIPTVTEVIDLLGDKIRNRLKINIELKNSIYPYPGMEEKIVGMIREYGLEKNVIYSSFSALSLEKIRELDSQTEIGILDSKVSDCLYKLRGGCGAEALHPYWKGIDLPAERIMGYTVRVYFSGHLYPEKPTGTKLNLKDLEQMGVTDVFLNEPERYL